MSDQARQERRPFLSTFPARAGERRLALGVVLLSTAVFLALAPFAKRPLAPVDAFLPIYQSALVVTDFITAVLLFGQFAILRSRALQVLACAYLFSSLMAVAHALTFPGLFTRTGLFAGQQTTAWLYFLWHGGFPLLVIGYALLRSRETQAQPPRGGALRGILAGIGVTAAAVCALMLLTTEGNDLLPVIMRGNSDAPAKVVVASLTWLLSLAALPALWRRRPHSVLDLWLMVAVFVWIFDSALAAVLNHARFDLGWYAGRVYGLLASSFVLAVLLLENGRLYALLAEAHADERRERRRAEERTAELAAVNRELDAFSYSVSHDLRAPLRAVDGYSRMIEEDYGDRLDEEGRRLLAVVRGSSQKMGMLIDDLLGLARVGRSELARAQVDMDALVREVRQELGELSPAQVELEGMPAGYGDRPLLKQVWANLMQNALKYSSKRDRPRVAIGGRADGAETVYWVRDNGVGFDMKYYDKLFGVFQRLHGADEFPGTGIGLAIVQRVVARHGGRVWGEGKPGEGAVFYFALPLEAG
ncbi:MAG: MASE4 domain-containing protein [Burkholderiales bacterium]